MIVGLVRLGQKVGDQIWIFVFINKSVLKENIFSNANATRYHLQFWPMQLFGQCSNQLAGDSEGPK